MKSPFLKLLGLFLLVAVIAIGVKIGVTNPFFSDTETSTNNALSVADSFDPNPGDVVINELMWMGSTKGTSDEWIELLNPGTEPVDLNGWTLTDGGDIDVDLRGVLASGDVAEGDLIILNPPSEIGGPFGG